MKYIVIKRLKQDLKFNTQAHSQKKLTINLYQKDKTRNSRNLILQHVNWGTEHFDQRCSSTNNLLASKMVVSVCNIAMTTNVSATNFLMCFNFSTASVATIENIKTNADSQKFQKNSFHVKFLNRVMRRPKAIFLKVYFEWSNDRFLLNEQTSHFLWSISKSTYQPTNPIP